MTNFRNKRNQTLKNQLGVISMIGYAAVVLILIILDYCLIYNNSRSIEKSNLEALENYIEDANTAMKRVYETTFDYYGENEDFQVLSYTEDATTIFNKTYQLMEQIEEQLQSNNPICGAVLFYENGESRRYTFEESFSYDEKMEIVSQTSEQMEQLENLKNGFLVWTEENVYYVRMMKRTNAAVAFVTKLNNIENGYSYEDKKLILTYGQIVLTEKELAKELEITGTDTKDSTQRREALDYRIYSGKLNELDIGAYIVVKNDYSFFFRPLSIALLFVTVLVIGFVGVLYHFLRNQILNPLKELTAFMIQIREGKKSEKLETLAPYQEFEDVRDAFNSMMSEIERLKISSYEEQIEKQHAQMQSFQLQLRPHFYLNCLKTLNYMAIDKDTENMQELILMISAQLRYLLKNEAKLVTVREELENVNGYFRLQQLLSNRKVACSINVEDNMLEGMIPILLIHTFVENTFKYAILDEKEDTLRIDIKGIILDTEQGRMLDISITDNGNGYPKDVLRVINAPDQVSDDGMAIGIMNVKQRCRLLYGDSAEYTFYNMPGAVSEVIIPFMLEEEVHDDSIGD